MNAFAILESVPHTEYSLRLTVKWYDNRFADTFVTV